MKDPDRSITHTSPRPPTNPPGPIVDQRTLDLIAGVESARRKDFAELETLYEQLHDAIELLKEADCPRSCSGKVEECWRTKRNLFLKKIEAMKGGGDE